MLPKQIVWQNVSFGSNQQVWKPSQNDHKERQSPSRSPSQDLQKKLTSSQPQKASNKGLGNQKNHKDVEVPAENPADFQKNLRESERKSKKGPPMRSSLEQQVEKCMKNLFQKAESLQKKSLRGSTKKIADQLGFEDQFSKSRRSSPGLNRSLSPQKFYENGLPVESRKAENKHFKIHIPPKSNLDRKKSQPIDYKGSQRKDNLFKDTNEFSPDKDEVDVNYLWMIIKTLMRDLKDSRKVAIEESRKYLEALQNNQELTQKYKELQDTTRKYERFIHDNRSYVKQYLKVVKDFNHLLNGTQPHYEIVREYDEYKRKSQKDFEKLKAVCSNLEKNYKRSRKILEQRIEVLKTENESTREQLYITSSELSTMVEERGFLFQSDKDKKREYGSQQNQLQKNVQDYPTYQKAINELKMKLGELNEEFQKQVNSKETQKEIESQFENLVDELFDKVSEIEIAISLPVNNSTEFRNHHPSINAFYQQANDYLRQVEEQDEIQGTEYDSVMNELLEREEQIKDSFLKTLKEKEDYFREMKESQNQIKELEGKTYEEQASKTIVKDSRPFNFEDESKITPEKKNRFSIGSEEITDGED